MSDKPTGNKPFPATLFVVRSGEGEGQYFDTADTVDGIDEEHEGEEVALYERVRVDTLRIRRELEPKK